MGEGLVCLGTQSVGQLSPPRAITRRSVGRPVVFRWSCWLNAAAELLQTTILKQALLSVPLENKVLAICNPVFLIFLTEFESLKIKVGNMYSPKDLSGLYLTTLFCLEMTLLYEENWQTNFK